MTRLPDILRHVVITAAATLVLVGATGAVAVLVAETIGWTP